MKCTLYHLSRSLYISVSSVSSYNVLVYFLTEWCNSTSLVCLCLLKMVHNIDVLRQTASIIVDCPFDITRKNVFCLEFYFKWKYFVLIVQILLETICLIHFCVLFSNNYPKIKFMAKHWSDQCKFYSEVIFESFVWENICYLSLLSLHYWCFTTLLWKFQNNWSVGNLLKLCLQVTYPAGFCIICIRFCYGKKWKYLIVLITNVWC